MAASLNACFDTSVLLRLLVGEPKTQARKAEALLTEILNSGGHIIISDLVLSECYFALQHHYNVPKPEAINALRELSRSDGIECSQQARSVLSQSNLHSARPAFIDRLIHGEYSLTGFEMVTFEKSARKLENTRIL